jgi:hypothetical protein
VIVKRTVGPVTLTKQEGETDWRIALDGEAWVFSEVENDIWQGFTQDHLTGTPRVRTLRAAIAWVIAERDSIALKLKTRRRAGTRLVDPA